MLAARGYKTKKALREAVGTALRFTETSFRADEFRLDGDNTLVGPGEYDRRWYATVTCRHGVIVKVK